jgi:hypothetical protein
MTGRQFRRVTQPPSWSRRAPIPSQIPEPTQALAPTPPSGPVSESRSPKLVLTSQHLPRASLLTSTRLVQCGRPNREPRSQSQLSLCSRPRPPSEASPGATRSGGGRVRTNPAPSGPILADSQRWQSEIEFHFCHREPRASLGERRSDPQLRNHGSPQPFQNPPPRRCPPVQDWSRVAIVPSAPPFTLQWPKRDLLGSRSSKQRAPCGTTSRWYG